MKSRSGIGYRREGNIDFVSAHQVGVVAEIPQEPAELPKCFGGAVKTTVKRTTLIFTRFKDTELQNVKWSLRMPPVESSIDANQEDAFQRIITCGLFTVQTGNMAFHDATSEDVE
jgi:hypothetical protein